MANEVKRDGFDGAMSSSAAPALRIWLPFWGGIEANDTWVARIFAFLAPIGLIIFSIIVAVLIFYLCYFWTFYRIVALNVEAFNRALNRNEVPALE